MKTQLFALFSLLFLAVSFQSCTEDACEREITYLKSIPNYTTWETIRGPIQSVAPRELEKPGKIYFYNDYIFVNEYRKGVHVIDNSNPSNPQNVSFIEIFGNVDISIRNTTLYADNFTDLLAINISDVFNARLVKRVEDVYPHHGITEEGVLTHYDFEEVTETVDCNSIDGEFLPFDGMVFSESGNLSSGSSAPNSPISVSDRDFSLSSGQGGSFARFTLYDNYLYTVTESDLNVFDVSQQDCPNLVNSASIGWGIETIFPYGDKLFIGSNSGMDIYDVSNPASPTYISGYTHFTGCDPVFVSGQYAYVTIRSGTNCNGGTLNQLDILDITDIFSPVLERSISMDNPHGLSVLEDHLYLCEGSFGLKVFDASNPLELDRHRLAHLKDFDAYDVIGLSGAPNRLLLIGSDGFYQFDVSDPSNPQQLSVISVQR